MAKTKTHRVHIGYTPDGMDRWRYCETETEARAICDRIHRTKGVIVALEAVQPITRVVYRMDGGEVIALFPDEAHDHTGRYCVCYVHHGQHCAADYHGVIARSRPATATEYTALHRELVRIGYRLRVIRRATRTKG